jgi:hypothetical protein
MLVYLIGLAALVAAGGEIAIHLRRRRRALAAERQQLALLRSDLRFYAGRLAAGDDSARSGFERALERYRVALGRYHGSRLPPVR